MVLLLEVKFHGAAGALSQDRTEGALLVGLGPSDLEFRDQVPDSAGIVAVVDLRTYCQGRERHLRLVNDPRLHVSRKAEVMVEALPPLKIRKVCGKKYINVVLIFLCYSNTLFRKLTIVNRIA